MLSNHSHDAISEGLFVLEAAEHGRIFYLSIFSSTYLPHTIYLSQENNGQRLFQHRITRTRQRTAQMSKSLSVFMETVVILYITLIV